MSSLQSFGPYELIERINIGGMAEVFRARDRAHGRQVAIKRILRSVAEDEEFIQMFRDEAVIASQLDHPNIARIFEVGRVENHYYLAIEYVQGKDLRWIYDRAARLREPVPLEVLLHITTEVCEGLNYAHDHSDSRGRPMHLVHRDVSPQNILVSLNGDVKVIDFGVAKAAGKLTRTQVGTIKGKFGYMSPEQVRGLPIDRRSDVFSFGICLWELLTLERLFVGESEVAIMEKIRSCEIAPPRTVRSTIPEELDRLVMRALAKDVDERYATMAELESDVRAFASAHGISADSSTTANYMRSAFGTGGADSKGEETASMADERGNPNLNETPTPLAPPALRSTGPQANMRKATLLGIPAPAPGPEASHGLPGRVASPTFRASTPPPVTGGTRSPSGLPASAPLPRAAAQTQRPGSAPPGAPPTPNLSVEMDWDDDEKTTVFDKGSQSEAEHTARRPAPPSIAPPIAAAPQPPLPAEGRTLTGTGPTSAPAPQLAAPALPGPPLPARSGIPGTLVPRGSIPSPPPVPRDLPAARAESVAFRRGPLPGTRYILMGLAAAAIAGAGYFFYPRTGVIRVFVAGAGGKPLDRFSVVIDGHPRCSGTPCSIELEKGVHAVRAMADGYVPQEQGMNVNSGAELAVNFKLDKASGGTGMRVAGKQDGVELFVDGKELGPLPQEIKDLAPGVHKLVFKGSDRYAPEERTITVNPDEILDLGVVTLKVLRGLATFDVRTPGARVTLVSGADRRQLTDFSQPVEIETAKNWFVEASKAGHESYRAPLQFEDRADKTFVIDLPERGVPATSPAAVERPRPAPATEPAQAAATESGTCTVNLNAIPVSTVLLDGKPVGSTPKVGVSVAAGSHSVVFLSPEGVRKSQSFSCRGGESKTVAVRMNAE